MQTATTIAPPRFKNILIATDFSVAARAALQDAIKLCSQLGSRLAILHVFEYAQLVAPDTGIQVTNLEPLRKDAQQQLQDLVEQAWRAGVPCASKISDGEPALTILDALEAGDIDLLVIGTNAFHGFERFIFGSTAEAVLRRSPCPVMTVGPHARASAERGPSNGPVVFATDFQKTTIAAIRYAEAFCKASDAPLHCLHVLPRSLEDGSQNHIVPQIMTEALQHVVVEGGIAIEDPVCAITYGSEVSNAVVAYAREQNAKLIVLGVRQGSLLVSHIPAHIAYRIITEAPCPVLTVSFKPGTEGNHDHGLPVTAEP